MAKGILPVISAEDLKKRFKKEKNKEIEAEIQYLPVLNVKATFSGKSGFIVKHSALKQKNIFFLACFNELVPITSKESIDKLLSPVELKESVNESLVKMSVSDFHRLVDEAKNLATKEVLKGEEASDELADRFKRKARGIDIKSQLYLQQAIKSRSEERKESIEFVKGILEKKLGISEVDDFEGLSFKPLGYLYIPYYFAKSEGELLIFDAVTGSQENRITKLLRKNPDLVLQVQGQEFREGSEIAIKCNVDEKAAEKTSKNNFRTESKILISKFINIPLLKLKFLAGTYEGEIVYFVGSSSPIVLYDFNSSLKDVKKGSLKGVVIDQKVDAEEIVSLIKNSLETIRANGNQKITAAKQEAMKMLDSAGSSNPTEKYGAIDRAKKVVSDAESDLESERYQYIYDALGTEIEENSEIAFLESEVYYYPFYLFMATDKDNFKFVLIDGVTGKTDRPILNLLLRIEEVMNETIGKDLEKHWWVNLI